MHYKRMKTSLQPSLVYLPFRAVEYAWAYSISLGIGYIKEQGTALVFYGIALVVLHVFPGLQGKPQPVEAWISTVAQVIVLVALALPFLAHALEARDYMTNKAKGKIAYSGNEDQTLERKTI